MRSFPATTIEFTQPIQMRFNELLAGVRGDVAVKVFGDEFEPMLRAANQIAGVLRGIDGAQDVKVEQTSGCPSSTSRSTRTRSPGSASASRGAGRDRRRGRRPRGRRCFRRRPALPDHRPAAGSMREDLEALKTCRSRFRARRRANARAIIPLKEVAIFILREGPNQISRENGKRRVVVHANVRGRDLASLVAEAQAKIAEQVTLAGRILARMGRPVRESDRGARSG